MGPPAGWAQEAGMGDWQSGPWGNTQWAVLGPGVRKPQWPEPCHRHIHTRTCTPELCLSHTHHVLVTYTPEPCHIPTHTHTAPSPCFPCGLPFPGKGRLAPPGHFSASRKAYGPESQVQSSCYSAHGTQLDPRTRRPPCSRPDWEPPGR